MIDEYKALSYDDIYEKMKTLVFGKPIKATDANNGSVLCSMLEAVSRVIAEGYLYCKTGYDKHLNSIPESAFGLKRVQGWKARGRVKFYTIKAKDDEGKESHITAEYDIPIRKGTELSNGSVEFVTLHDGLIKKGESESDFIEIEAKKTGEAGNVPSGSITTIISGLSNRIGAVRNDGECSNGRSKESDVAFRKRFVHYLRGLQRTNKDGVMKAVLDTGAKHVNIENKCPAIFINKNGYSNYPCNCIVYVCDKEGQASSDLLKAVRDKLEGDGSKTNSGYTPAGINIAVLPVEIKRFFGQNGKKLLIKVNSSLNDKEEATKVIQNEVVSFFKDFTIGQNLVITDLIVAIRAIPFVHDVRLRLEGDAELNVERIEAGHLLVVKEEDIIVDFNLG